MEERENASDGKGQSASDVDLEQLNTAQQSAANELSPATRPSPQAQHDGSSATREKSVRDEGGIEKASDLGLHTLSSNMIGDSVGASLGSGRIAIQSVAPRSRLQYPPTSAFQQQSYGDGREFDRTEQRYASPYIPAQVNIRQFPTIPRPYKSPYSSAGPVGETIPISGLSVHTALQAQSLASIPKQRQIASLTDDLQSQKDNAVSSQIQHQSPKSPLQDRQSASATCASRYQEQTNASNVSASEALAGTAEQAKGPPTAFSEHQHKTIPIAATEGAGDKSKNDSNEVSNNTTSGKTKRVYKKRAPVEEDDAATQSTPIKKKRAYNKKAKTEADKTQIDGTPMRQKRAYNKKVKVVESLPVSRDSTNRPDSSPVPIAAAPAKFWHEALAVRDSLNADSQEEYGIHGKDVQSPENSAENTQRQAAFLLEPDIHEPNTNLLTSQSPGTAAGDNVPQLATGPVNFPLQEISHTSRFSSSGQTSENQDYEQGQSPFQEPLREQNRSEIRFEEFDEEGTQSDDSSDDEYGGERNAVYSNIMSQVNIYTGKGPSETGHKRAKKGLEDFLKFTEAEDQGEEPTSVKGNEPRKRIKHRGPRIAAEPTGEIKMRLGLANEAFAESNIDEARRLVDEIIRINAETYEAWNLLSSICQEQNNCEEALMALIVAAHLRPKHVGAWFNAVDYALTSMGPLTPTLLREAEFCLSSCVRQVPTNIEARIRKAQVIARRGKWNRAASDYKHLLKLLPYDLDIIRELGEVYVDLGDGVAGIELYQRTFKQFHEKPELYELAIDWNHANNYAQLWTFLDKKGDEALLKVKALARYLLGREEETYWNEVTENDCEWDVDDTRRMSIVRYAPGNFPAPTYGEGLPIELRVSLGKFRFSMGQYDEALHHFSFLFGEHPQTGEYFRDTHPEALLHVAELFDKVENYKEALHFYRAVKQVPDQNCAELCIAIGRCYLREDLSKDAEEVFREACFLDETNIAARVELARMYEKMDETEQAFDYVNQILYLESHKRTKLYSTHNLPVQPGGSKSYLPNENVNNARLKKPPPVPEKVMNREALADNLRTEYTILREKTEGMRAGNAKATDSWMDAARQLTEDFRSCKAFYPWDRKAFEGYTAEDQIRAEQNLKLDFKVLSQMHGEDIGGNPDATSYSTEVPTHYRGVAFKDWIEIFSEYAFCLARRGRGREAYDICEAATHAICFCFDKESMFSLQLAYCACALISNDEETCVAMARWFMVQYQFATDSYRMFAALMRMCHSPISWYSSGPTQKFVLRQIKTMDYAVSNETRRKVIHRDKATYSHMDKHGRPIINEELDVNLLMVYGHILIAGASYLYALNYFHRALALDPENPMILLALGLSYMQYALKRQIDNRQFSIMQGLTILHKYYTIRSQSPNFEERQEAHYNLARAYHLVGLTNLALPLYKRVLKAEGRKRAELGGRSINGKGKRDAVGISDQKRGKAMEDMCVDTAYNLQIIYSVAGNNEMAQKITRRWLVV